RVILDAAHRDRDRAVLFACVEAPDRSIVADRDVALGNREAVRVERPNEDRVVEEAIDEHGMLETGETKCAGARGLRDDLAVVAIDREKATVVLFDGVQPRRRAPRDVAQRARTSRSDRRATMQSIAFDLERFDRRRELAHDEKLAAIVDGEP